MPQGCGGCWGRRIMWFSTTASCQMSWHVHVFWDYSNKIRYQCQPNSRICWCWYIGLTGITHMVCLCLSCTVQKISPQSYKTQNSLLFWVSHNWALFNLAQELCFQGWLNLYTCITYFQPGVHMYKWEPTNINAVGRKPVIEYNPIQGAGGFFSGEGGEKEYSWLCHTTEIGITFSSINHMAWYRLVYSLKLFFSLS